MQFAYILRQEKEEMVQVNATRFTTEKEIFFAVDEAGFEEIRETALAFECSVLHEYEKCKTLEGKETSSSSSEDEEQQESVADPVVYVRQRNEGPSLPYSDGKCAFRIISVIMQLMSLKKQKKLK